MTSETVMVLLLSIFTIGCVVQASPIPGPSTYESMTEWIQRIEAKGAEERKSLKTLIDQKESHIKALQAKVDKLSSNGYLGRNIQDITWQSLHMAAAASCRAISATGGTGPATNMVYPRGGGKTCTQICKESRYHNCDGSLSISGFVGRAVSTKQAVANYYNYGCNSNGNPEGHEPDGKVTDIVKYQYHLGYCCCRMS